MTFRGEAAEPSPFALFLDFDGTLVEIAPSPDAVTVPRDLPAILARLRGRLGGALAIVSGRPIVDLDRYLPELDASGLHGLERRAGGVMDRPDLPDLAPEIARLRERFASVPGALVEDKGIGVAVHWRRAPEAEAEARAAIFELAQRLGPPYRVQDGKAVCELVAGAAHKGDGIRALMREPPYRGRRPIFAGDDRTDEAGFAAVRELGGVGVKVGAGPTGAAHRVASVADLAKILAAWAVGGVALERLPAA
ncbi:MAG: trehalose-phosphatase [Methylobacteriaceae bacterium]|nr:trehalose-phosphatase [Methylobacteriaceae bacterium]